MTAATRPKLSVVVCSFNGAERITACLRALATQDAAQHIEIIVVDDGSTDTTVATAQRVLGEFATRHQVISLDANAGLSAARNAGVAAASAPFVAFTDDDCIPAQRWTGQLIELWAAAGPETHGIGGEVDAESTDTLNRRFLAASQPLRPVELGTLGQSFPARLARYLRPRRFSGARRVDAFVGANMSFRTASILDAGGFDDSIRFGGDELEMCRRITTKFGVESLQLEPALRIAHEFHPSLRDTIRRSHSYGAGNGRDWSRQGGVPSLLPGGIVTVAAAVAADVTVHPLAALLLAVLVPFLLGSRLLTAAASPAHRAERVLYPFIRLICEFADNIGFISGAFDASRPQSDAEHADVEHVDAEHGDNAATLPPSPRDTAPQRGIARYAGWVWFASIALLQILPDSWPVTATGSVAIVLLAGSSIAALIGFTPHALAARVLTATAFGATALMVVGVLLSLTERLGIERPLDRPVTLGAWAAVFAALLTATSLTRRDPWAWFTGASPLPGASRLITAAILPASAALATARLNATGDGRAVTVVTVLALLAVLVTIAATWSGRRNWPVELIAASSVLTVVWTTTTRGFGLYGWDIQQEWGVALETIGNGVWFVPADGSAYASMLSLTVLPAQLHALTGLSAEAALRWLFPLVLAVLVAGLVALVRRRAAAGPALAAVMLAVAAGAPFVRELPAITRQEFGFALFATMLTAICATEVPLRARRIATVLAGAGLAVAHYTTSYATVVMLLTAVAFTAFNRRGESRRKRQNRVLSLAVVIGIVASTLLWNGVITRPGTELGRATQTFSSSGLRILDNGQGSLVKSWLSGTGSRIVPAESYHDEVVALRDTLEWVQTDPDAEGYVLTDATAPKLDGAVPQAAGLWSLLLLGARQLFLLAVVVAFATMLRRRRPDDAEIIGLAVGALAIAALLRLSTVAGTLYNPERAALHTGMVFAFLLAPLLARSSRRGTIALVAVAAFTFSGWGLASPVFGGPAPAAAYAYGENTERYVTAASDRAVGQWLKTIPDDKVLVYADRYGRVSLLSVERGSKFSVIDTVVPDTVDTRGYVYFTSMNTSTDRARGQLGDRLAVFRSPEKYFEDTRALVWSSGASRVYR